VGIFEIVEPVLEGDEVFDSNLLKQTMESMIAAGRRNISVDLSLLDYLYSDAINALVVMNKRMLDVFGRLSLLAPQPPVMEILKKGGIQNILKIFTDEAEIVQLSQQMTGQPMAAPAPAAQVPPPQPQSEFDDLRSEIGSAFEQGPDATAMPGMPAAATKQYAPQPAMPQQRPQFAPPARRPSFAPPPPAAGGAPRYAPPPRGFEPQRPPARAFTPPPPKPAPAPLAHGGETRRMPPVPEAPVALRPHVEPVAEPQPEEDLEKIEASLERKMPAPGKHKPEIEAAEAAPKKRSLVPMLVALVVLIVAGAGGYYSYITYFQKTTATPTPAPAPSETPAPAIPQLPVETTNEAPAPAASAVAPVAEAPALKPVVKTPEPIKVKKQPAVTVPVPKRIVTPVVVAPKPFVREPIPTKPVVVERPRVEEPEPVETPKPAPVVAAPEPTQEAPAPTPAPAPAPAPAAEPAAGSGEATIFIGTLPPLADVYMDGKYIGKSSTELKVTPGTHTLRFVKADKEFSKQFTFQAGKNPGTFVKLP